MLRALFKAYLPHRFLFPARRRFRDQPMTWKKGDVSIVRLAAFLVGGVLLASLVLMAATIVRDPAAQSQLRPSVRAIHAVAAEPAEPAPILATDARAMPEADEQASAAKTPDRVVAKVTNACAEQAREKLITGLTHYYMQRMLRPAAPSEEASDGAGLATLMAGPGDPATASGKSCTG
jgi:hypothetical protein